MILKMFALYDSKAEAYNKPFYHQTTGAALRDFEEACKNPESFLCKYPQDFTLFEIGYFDDTTAEIVMHDSKISLGTAQEYIHSPKLKLAGE